MTNGTVPFNLSAYDGGWKDLEDEVIEEGQLTIYANGQEWATLMCTPRDPDPLALGFLANEEVISSIREVEILHHCPSGCVDIWLSHPAKIPNRRKIITSGCGGGQTFLDLQAQRPPLESDLRISPEQIAGLMNHLQTRDSLYARAGGVHTSALCCGDDLVVVAEDIGRHNTLDRLRGECLLRGIDPQGMVVLTTGRISSEMMLKAAKMGCPVVGSRTSPTSLSVQLAQAWNITLCGYVRHRHLRVYAHPERLQGDPGEIDELFEGNGHQHLLVHSTCQDVPGGGKDPD